MDIAVQEIYNKAVDAYDRGAYEVAVQEYEKALKLSETLFSGKVNDLSNEELELVFRCCMFAETKS